MRIVGLVCVLGMWAGLTAHRVPAWQDARSLWTAASQVTPQQPSVWLLRGITAMQQGCATSAKPFLDRAHQLLEARPAKRHDQLRQLLWYWSDRVAGFSEPPC